MGTLVLTDDDLLAEEFVAGKPVAPTNGVPTAPAVQSAAAPPSSAWTDISARQSAHIIGTESADMLDLVMATVLCPLLDPASPVWVFIVGPPSNGKTMTAKHLEKSPHVVAKEKLLGSAISSGYKDPRGRRATPLLSKLHNKTLLMSETAPTFALGDEVVKKVFSDLTGAYDGSLGQASGMDMDDDGRQYAKFGFLACATTENYVRFEHYLERIGTRWLIYRLPALSREERAVVREVNKDQVGRRAKTAELTERVMAHVEGLWTRHDAKVGLSDDANERLGQMAEVLAHCRGSISDEGEVSVDGSSRSQQQLQTLSVALAMVRERPEVGRGELELLWRLVLGSMPRKRARVIRAFLDHPEGPTRGLTVAQYLEEVKVSDAQAARDLDELVALDLLTRSIPTSETHRAIYRPTEALTVAAGLGPAAERGKCPPKSGLSSGFD